MKKLKIVLLCLTVILSSSFFFACNGKKKNNINVEGLNFVYEEKDVNKIEVAVGQEIELKVKYIPENANNLSFTILAYENNLLTITQDSEDKCLFKVKISNDIESNTSTTIGVALKYNPEIQSKCVIDIKKEYEQLNAPTNVTYNMLENRLEWTSVSVDNIQDYTIDVNGELYTSSTNYLDFDAINKFDQELTVKVKANGPYNFYDSNYSAEYKFTKLSIPNELTHKDCVLSWQNNKLATRYDLDIQNLTIQSHNQGSTIAQESETVVSYNAFALLQEAGTYSIKVKAIGDESKNIFSSNFTQTLQVIRLELPQGYKLENNVLSWNTSLGAVKYSIIMNGTTISEEFVSNPLQVQNLTFNITEEFLNGLTIGENGEGIGENKNQFEFSIQAVGDGTKTLNSAITKVSSLTKLATNQIGVTTKQLDLQDYIQRYNVISWQPSEQTNAKYELEIKYVLNNQEKTSIIQTENTELVLNSNFLSGIYKIRVRSLGDGINTFSGNYSNQIQVKKFSPINTSAITYNAGTGDLTFKAFDATNFDVFINQKPYAVVSQNIENAVDGDFNKIATINLNDKITEEGSYNIQIVSKYLDYAKTEEDVLDGYVDSELSENYSITKLTNPQLNILNNKELTFNNIENASSYLLEIYETIVSGGENQTVEHNLLTFLTTTQTTVNILELKDENDEFLIKENKTYSIRIKAIGTNNKTISSNYSNYLNIQLLSSPTIEMQNGKLTIANKNLNAISFDYFVNISGQDTFVKITEENYLTELGYENFLSNYSSKELNIYAVANGQQKNNINYLTSKNGITKTFYQLGQVEDVLIENQILSFNPVIYEDKKQDLNDIYDITYKLKFYAKNEQDTDYIEVTNVEDYGDEVLLTIENKSDFDNGKIKFALADYLAKCLALKNSDENLIFDINNNNVNFKIQILAQTDNIKLLQNKNFAEYEFTKLQTPTLSVTTYQEMIENANCFSESNLSGLLKFNKVNNAYDYTLNAYSVADNKLVYSKNIGQFINEFITHRFDDKLVDDGEYNFKLIANGNGTNLLSSDVFNLTNIKKFSAPNLFIKNGSIEWEGADYSHFEKVFLSVEINGSPIVIYNEEQVREILNSNPMEMSDKLKSLLHNISVNFPIYGNDSYLTSDEVYDISIYAIPVNFGENNLVSSRKTIYNVKRIPTSAHTFIEDGKFYFSKVENASGYSLWVNGKFVPGFRLDVDYVDVGTINNVGYYCYDFAKAYNATPGDYSVAIQALTTEPNMVNSNASMECVVTVMETSNITIEDGILNYSAVNGATKYDISIFKASNGERVFYDVIENERLQNNDFKIVFDESFDAGKYDVQIIAYGNEVNYITNYNASNRTVEKLETPTNLQIQLGKIVWNDVIKSGCYYGIITNGVTSVNGKNIGTNNYYELDSSFDAGDYNSIQIQAMGQYSYLNSDISYSLQSNDGNTSFVATKLNTPDLYTMDGELYLSSLDKQNTLYYELSVGGKLYNVGKVDKLVNLAQGLQTYTLDENGILQLSDFVVITGTNDVKLKCIGSFDSNGNEQGYLNSDYSKTIHLSILNNVANIKVLNGTLTWDRPSKEGNLILHYIKGGVEKFVNVNGLASYEFEESGLYEIYFINNGNTSQNKDCSITSKMSKVYKVQKFDEPNKLVPTLQQDGSVKLETELLENASGYEFILDDNYVLSNTNNNSIVISVITKSITINGEKQNATYLICNGNEYEVSDTYSIKVRILGDENALISEDSTNEENSSVYYLNSNYSEALIGAIPESPVVKVEKATSNNQTFATGKVYWDKVYFDQNIEVDKYLVSGYYFKQDFVSYEVIENTYDYLVTTSNNYLLKITANKVYVVPNNNLSLIYNNNNLIELTTDEYSSFGIEKINEKATTKNSYHVGAEGNYFIYVRSLILSSGTFSSSTSCYLKFDIYSNGDGSESNPYIISTPNQFVNIKYGMDEGIYYRLADDIDFSNSETQLSVMGDKDNKFNANLDGNGKSILNINLASGNNEYVGLFSYIGNTGVVKNLNIKNAQVVLGYYLGIIAGYNQGVIKDCLVSGVVYTDLFTLSKDVINGGICAQNSGTIDNCVVDNLQIKTVYNTVSNYSAYAGGVCGINDSTGIIKNCEILSNSVIGLSSTTGNNKTAQYSGGVCAINMGQVIACVNNANVYAQSAGNKNAYAGGVVALNDRGYIYSCVNTGSVSAIANVQDGAKSYVGGIVGRNVGDVLCSVIIDYSGKIEISAKASSSNFRCGLIAGENKGYINQCVINGIDDNMIELNINDLSYQVTKSNLQNLLIGSGNAMIDASDYEAYTNPIYNAETGEVNSKLMHNSITNVTWILVENKIYPKAR